MGFSADWLALREPADLAARDPALLRRAAAMAGERPVVLDLGCGTGATMRAMAPHLPPDTRWRLVDNDPDLLRRAAAVPGMRTEIVQADLRDVDSLPLEGADIVTASALLDLVSEEWLRAFAVRLSAPFYAALSYDGKMSWTPADTGDATVTAAFNADQKRDKGFGPALGPDAAPRAAEIFAEAGFTVLRAPSPWRLDPDMAPLQRALTVGIAQATAAPEWGHLRRDAAPWTACRIGHEDILATPIQSPGDHPNAPR